MKQTNLEWLMGLDYREAVRQYNECLNFRSDSGAEFIKRSLKWLSDLHIEPITLTDAEWKAAELAVAIGLPWIRAKGGCGTLISGCSDSTSFHDITNIPNIQILCSSTWVTFDPLDLRTLLAKEDAAK